MVRAALVVRDANNGGRIMNAVKELKRRSKSVGVAMRDLNLDLSLAEEIEPDDFDLELIAEAERENDGSVISLEQLAEELMRRIREVRMGIVERHDLIEG